jgi:L-fuculose-phosphate aldolase
LVACTPQIELKRGIIPESIAYLKKIEKVPYYHPGSSELAKEAARRSLKGDVLLLENHGVLCVGTSLKEVVKKAETLEFLARLTITARQSKVKLKALPKEIVLDLEQTLREKL